MKWICTTECYVQVSGSWGYFYVGDHVEGEINEASQKHFRLVSGGDTPENAPSGLDALTNRQLRDKLDAIDVKYGKNDNKAALIKLLNDNQPDKED